MKQIIAILGAGGSKRFGIDKLTQPCAGKPLGQWALDVAEQASSQLLWIAGEKVPPFVIGRCPTLHNPLAIHGLGTSIACAAKVAVENSYEELLVMLADMPLLSLGTVKQLLKIRAPAACRYPSGSAGVPALFPKGLFSKLVQLSGDQGAASLLSEVRSLTLLDCDPMELFDVDLPSELRLADAELRVRRLLE